MEEDHAVSNFYSGNKSPSEQGPPLHSNNSGQSNNLNLHSGSLPSGNLNHSQHGPGGTMMSSYSGSAPSPMMMGARGGFSRSYGGAPDPSNNGPDIYHNGGSSIPGPQNTMTISVTSAYVGNLHPSTTKDELMSHFVSCGTMRRVTIPIHPNGQVRGCGYLEFETQEGLHRSLQLHNTTLKGNTLEVYAKRDTHRRGGRGGRGGGGGGFSRGGMYGGPMPMFMPQHGMPSYQMPNYGSPMGGNHMGHMRGWGGPRGGQRPPNGPPSGPLNNGPSSGYNNGSGIHY